MCVGSADVGDIQSRLLHHRPIINAEICYFVREFEVLTRTVLTFKHTLQTLTWY